MRCEGTERRGRRGGWGGAAVLKVYEWHERTCQLWSWHQVTLNLLNSTVCGQAEGEVKETMGEQDVVFLLHGTAQPFSFSLEVEDSDKYFILTSKTNKNLKEKNTNSSLFKLIKSTMDYISMCSVRGFGCQHVPLLWSKEAGSAGYS